MGELEDAQPQFIGDVEHVHVVGDRFRALELEENGRFAAPRGFGDVAPSRGQEQALVVPAQEGVGRGDGLQAEVQLPDESLPLHLCHRNVPQETAEPGSADIVVRLVEKRHPVKKERVAGPLPGDFGENRRILTGGRACELPPADRYGAKGRQSAGKKIASFHGFLLLAAEFRPNHSSGREAMSMPPAS